MRCCWVEGWKEGERAARREEGGYFMDHFRYWGLPVARRQTDSREDVVSKTVEGGTRKTEEEGRRASSLALVLALFARLPSRCSARRRKRIRVTDLPTSTRERERERPIRPTSAPSCTLIRAPAAFRQAGPSGPFQPRAARCLPFIRSATKLHHIRA